MLGYHPPEGGTPLEGGTPSPSPWDHAPPRTMHPPQTMQPPRTMHPPDHAPRHIVNERPVRILLECILVLVSHPQKLRIKICQKTCPFLSHRPDHLQQQTFFHLQGRFCIDIFTLQTKEQYPVESCKTGRKFHMR